ncbi:4a-hydroxytetrahydrobiopterin dehydratase [Haloactinopolyspora alba]|uniref:Putative pterin-4-alpha-carbinolamine dehydratase n=1 Tax=Haloactinopolyspora alba TaxID=648780 RepID=A0A2P8DX73_9ACTN|nr:4a-hydroxytetrahydrobiopterin dehydratase [Haloactinopolyspora alba]PSL01813.1 4a-hydroxytetrahydrobiopterin dehydratase [Haloactinopolyspora alba]
MTLLDTDDIRSALDGLPEWSGDTSGITRTVEAPDFPTGIAVVDDVAEAAEAADHHPDIDIRWRTLTFALVTHSAGGVTRADVDMAHAIDRIVARHTE